MTVGCEDVEAVVSEFCDTEDRADGHCSLVESAADVSWVQRLIAAVGVAWDLATWHFQLILRFQWIGRMSESCLRGRFSVQGIDVCCGVVEQHLVQN